jgi:hypothetical protein
MLVRFGLGLRRRSVPLNGDRIGDIKIRFRIVLSVCLSVKQ